MNQAIIILGYGKSTQSAIQVLQKQYEAQIYIYDETENHLEIPETCTRVNKINEVPIKEVLFCLKSPGISYDKEYVKYLLDAKVEVYTDVELFLSSVKGKIIAITGTNGKTTVTTLVGNVLKQKFTDVRVCGNIGIPIAEVCQNAKDDTIFVVELSSFQLKGTKKFKPDISVLLNLSEAHLDYHETASDYEQSKANIFSRQNSEDILIYNADDIRVLDLVQSSNATGLAIGQDDTADICLKTDKIMFQGEMMYNEIIKVPGEHNRFNSAVAFAVGVLCGVKREGILRAISTFQGVKHRLQYVSTIDKRMIYNDSKSTNEFAVKTALLAFHKPLIWICGGYDRKIPYDDISKDDLKYVKHMIIYGMMTPVFLEIAEKMGIPYTVVEQFDQILIHAMMYSVEKDTILFSPGAASYDMFNNFEQRGDAFLELVEEYQQKINKIDFQPYI